MRSREFVALAAALLCLLFVNGSALASHHEEGEEGGNGGEETTETAWDAERMTQLTADLAKQMRAVRDAFRQSPNFRNPAGPNRRAADAMAGILKSLDSSCSSLATRVSRGQGAEETRGLARRIGSLLNDADVEGRRLMNHAWTDERIGPAMKTINEIAPFYGRGPLFDVDTLSRVDRGSNPSRRQEGE